MLKIGGGEWLLLISLVGLYLGAGWCVALIALGSIKRRKRIVLIARIEGCTRELGKSQGYLVLPVRDEVVDGVPYMVTAWEPTPEELKLLNAGAKIHLSILGNGHPPVKLEVAPLKQEKEDA